MSKLYLQLNNRTRVPLKIVLIYILIGGLWIVFSDQLVGILVPDLHTVTLLSTLKGWFFIAFTATVLFLLIKRNLVILEDSQQKLRESEQLFRDMSNGAPVMLWMSDSNGSFKFVNQRWLTFTGRSIQQELNNGWLDVIYPEDLASFESIYHTAHTTRQYFETEVRLKHTDEVGYRWVLATGTPRFSVNGASSGFVGSCLDITERKLAEEALKGAYDLLEQRVVERTAELEHAKDRLEAIFNHSGDGILLLDTTCGIQKANYAFEDLFRVSNDYYFGAPLATLFKTEDAARIDTSIQKVVETREMQHVEAPMERSDGTGFDVEISLAPMNRSDSAVTSLVCIFHDVTERKHAEEVLRQTLAQEKELGELKSRFVSIASHEFRTPLAAILATTETLTAYRERLDSAQIDARLDKIRQQVMHMKDIMEGVLQLERIQSGRVQFNATTGDFESLCLEIIEEFESQPVNQGRITYTHSSKPMLLDFDPYLMRGVINNLISNALKYSPQEKSIEVELSREIDEIRLRVKDKGIGIPAEDLKHLFEPFHRAGNVGNIAGTGLGLSIAWKSVEMHGGTLVVESQQGVGSTFNVTIPVKTNNHNQNLNSA